MIELGDIVRDKLTGFKGVVVAKIQFLNGCIQYSVLPKAKKTGEYPEDVGIDEQNIEIISKRNQKPKIKRSPPGGKVTRGAFMRNH